MAAPTVFEDIAEGFDLDGVGQLFAGKKFWVAQRVPSRNRLVDDIKANGGEIVLLEKKADYLIADHFRKDCPPGSISYEFVEKSIQDGRIRDPEDHRAGPPSGEAREPGAINRPAKGGRAAYTAEEDKLLYKWVRDCEAAGGQASGNEIYKQLEAKHPRHTWQSWRDRYLKQLRNRPPSAFNIPDNAPPSPPSDTPVEKASATSYTVEQLAATFDSDDWEELYAFVDTIDAMRGQKEYKTAWVQWAKNQDNQTAEQWRQYYEKVVRPQWLRDPAWKRKQIREKIEKKHNDDPSGSQTIVQQQEETPLEKAGAKSREVASKAVKKATSSVQQPSDSDHQRFEQILEERRADKNDDTAAYVFFAREKKWATWNAKPELDYTNLHKLLMSQWESMSSESKAPYMAFHQATKQRAQVEVAKLAPEAKLVSSSTAQHESPKYISDLKARILKRVRGDNHVEEEDPEEQSRQSKRQKSTSPVIEHEAQHETLVGTEQMPLEILSSHDSTSSSQIEANDEQAREQIMQDIEETQQRNETLFAQDFEEVDKEIESVESDELPSLDHIPPPLEIDEPSEDEIVSNTPTPRASRQRINNFDTQAILSSPSQGIGISRLPYPVGYTQDLDPDTVFRSSSAIPHPESDASTTQSLQDFRRSLNDEDLTQVSYPILKPLARPMSPSPAPSDFSDFSTVSGDPDVPLDASEFDEFFAAQHAEGFDDDFITKALKRTRCRPGLAELVLEAWKEGKPLPNQRGIWSVEDDEAAESGDGLALAKLEKKHSLDGWGGLTERMKFLDSYRSR